MNRWVVSTVMAGLAIGLVAVWWSHVPAADPQPAALMLAHDVYFTLKTPTVNRRDQLISACQKYLSGHPGTVWFAAGPLAEDLRRPVNDLDFHVALHLVFKDKAAHDAYQVSERHIQFINENKELWSKVRVFDSYLPVFSHGDTASQAAPAK